MIEDRILDILKENKRQYGTHEWVIARNIYPDFDELRSKKGARIRVIVQSLWRLRQKGKVLCFFTTNNSRLWIIDD